SHAAHRWSALSERRRPGNHPQRLHDRPQLLLLLSWGRRSLGLPTPPHHHPRRRMTPRYEAVIVDRIPAASGPPTLVEIDALVGVRNVSWQRRLSAPDQASIGFPARLQSDEVKTRLMALDEYPVELWIYRNDDL